MKKTTAKTLIDKKNVGSIIKQLRRQKGMTQQQLADKLKVSRTSVANWENGLRIIDCVSVVKMSKIFGVSADYIYGRSDKVYNIKVPDDIELDLSCLNGLGIEMLCEFYKYLLTQKKFLA